MRLSRALMWTLALGLAASAAWLWPDVPARVPVHFGLDGEPDRWVGRSAWAWFGLPLVALATAAGHRRADAVVAEPRPTLPAINLPNKDKPSWRLPPERRAPVLARVGAVLYAVGAVCVVAFALVQADVWAVAQGSDGAPWALAGHARSPSSARWRRWSSGWSASRPR